MEEVLLSIGSIAGVEHNGEFQYYLITGKRVINFNSMKAWDYYSVPFPDGNKKDKQGNDDNGFYFNHPDIDEILYICDIKLQDNKND